jgi:hypothetical protein
MLDKNLFTILEWITSKWFSNIPDEKRSMLLRTWLKLIQLWIRNNGISHTIKRIKIIRLTVTRYLCGHPLYVNDLMVGVTSDGFPASILFMKELADSEDPQSLRFILTLLGISRAMKAEGKVNYNSITDPFKGITKSLPNNFIELFVKDFCFPYEDNKISIRDFFLNLKSGPSSGPAILHAHQSTRYFTGRNLWGLTTLLGSDGMRWFVNLFLKTKIIEKQPSRNRKLHIIHDPELKERVIAIFDYISQLAFEPLSKYLFKVLETIPQDRTFTQDPIILNKKESERFHSLDLSAATDRFPIDLQVDLLNAIERASPRPYRKIGNAWKNLMVAEPFLAPTGELLYYKVGQPMGARSSWAAFTLSHHLVVQFAAYECNSYPFKDYILLGDDIVIYNDIVACKYKEVINSLGVDCSPSKSHESVNTYEFAKRWFRNGIEISPVPLKGFLANRLNPALLFQDILSLVYTNRGPKSFINSVELGIDLLKRFGYTRSQIRFYSQMFTDLRFVHRVSSKHPDLQLLRNFLGYASRFNEYIIPFDEATLLKEFSRTSSLVVNGMVMTVCHNLSKYYNTFEKNFSNYITTQHTWSECQSLFGYHPLVYSLYSSVCTFEELNKSLGYTIDLNRQLTTVTVLDLEKLKFQARTSVDKVFTHRSFARKLRNIVEFDPYQLMVKAQTMRFGRSLLDIRLAFNRANPRLKTGLLVEDTVFSITSHRQGQDSE